ncbi:outer dynein arm-docking complex subunit 3-like [Ptychodera flava]|uniref:outer dynein arm-docking complex subunit 3-like n=1 Tax=Ptychodera flava TaxID=63121 RepID=UPI003969C818
MPGSNLMTPGWTLSDHIEEFRSKIALKDRDHRAYLESSQIAKKRNEEHILHLRKQCKEKRIELANSNNGDETVIQTVFENRQRERLSLQRNTAEQAIAAIDQKFCEKAKLLNLMTYQSEQKEKRLEELQAMYKRNKKLESQSKATDENDSQQRIRKLENRLDKAKIKISTAMKIQVNYRDILSRLAEESHIFPGHVRSLESALEEQKTELEELREINADAQAGRELTKANLTKLEHEVVAARRQRDKSLNAKKKQAEKQKDAAERSEKRQLRATLQTADDFSNDPQFKTRLARDNLMKISDYEDAMRKIKDAHSISQFEDILKRVVDQKMTSEHLNEQTTLLETQLRSLKKEKISLHRQYETMKYTGDKKASFGQSLVDKMADHLEEERKRHAEMSEAFVKTEKIQVDAVTGIESLYEKTKEVRLKPPSRSFLPEGDVMDKLGLIEAKLTHILDLLELKDKHAVKKVLAGQEFQDFIESSLPPENVRICIEEEDDYVTNELDYDSQDNEETLTRQDIKNRGQHILEKKTRKRGRKRKN